MRPSVSIAPALVAACSLLLDAGCTGEGKALKYGPGELGHERLHPVELRGRVLTQGDYLAQPGRVLRVGEHLLVLDRAADSVLHLISARDGSRLRSQGRQGAGPGEYQGAWSLAPDFRDPESAWAYDIALTRFTRVPVAGNTSIHRDPEIITLSPELLPTQPLWISDSVFVTPNFSPRGRLLFFDRRGHLLRAGGVLPTDSRGTPESVLQQAWVGRLALRPDRQRMVLVTQYADQVELYRADGSPLRQVRGPFRFDPRFTVADLQGFKTMSSDESMRHGYVDVTVTDDRIYALFSGRTREAFGGDASFGRYVHVFDWDGQLVKVLKLDRDLISVALSADRRRLYGASHNPEPAIMSFDLDG